MAKRIRAASGTIYRAEFTERTHKMIGREDQLRKIENCLRQSKDRHFLYFYAPGGLGKTRLLEETVALIKSAGPGYRCSGIIDLYHTEMHSPLDVQEAVVAGLDPKHQSFSTYRDKREEYLKRRELEPKSSTTVRLRGEMVRAFQFDFRELARTVSKVVLCFDTFEQVLSVGSVVDEAAVRHAPDLWLETWLFDNLRNMDNVLAVAAGRPKPSELAQTNLIETMRRVFGAHFEPIPLPPLTRGDSAIHQ